MLCRVWAKIDSISLSAKWENIRKSKQTGYENISVQKIKTADLRFFESIWVAKWHTCRWPLCPSIPRVVLFSVFLRPGVVYSNLTSLKSTWVWRYWREIGLMKIRLLLFWSIERIIINYWQQRRSCCSSVKKLRRGITRITVGRSQTWYLEHIAQYRIHVQVWCIVGSVSKLTQSARLENMRKSKRIRVDLSAKSATGTSPCKKKTADLRKPAIYRRSSPNIWKTEKTSELSEDHGRLPYRIVWIIPTELLRESMAFMRRCIIAVCEGA
jgi:hypothetical protein